MYSLPVKALNSPPIASISRGDVARRRPPRRPLEEHVLGEVRDPIRLGRLVPRAGREHDEARDRLRAASVRSAPAGRSTASGARRPPSCGHGIEAPVAEKMRQAGGAAGMARAGADPPAAAGRPRRRYRLRNLVPRRADDRPRRRPDALEAVLAPPDADLLRPRQPRGRDAADLEAARAFAGPKWLVTAKPEGPIASLCDEVIVATPEVEEATATRPRTRAPSPRSRRFAARISPGSPMPSPSARAGVSRCPSISAS